MHLDRNHCCVMYLTTSCQNTQVRCILSTYKHIYMPIPDAYLHHTHSYPPEPTFASEQNARASHWLYAGLLTTLCLLQLEAEPSQGSTHPSASLLAINLILTGTGIAIVITSFLSATARVWAPVRSGEYQMVTLDFLALLAYFVGPLLFVWYLGFEQLLPFLPPVPSQVSHWPS